LIAAIVKAHNIQLAQAARTAMEGNGRLLTESEKQIDADGKDPGVVKNQM